MKYFVEPTSIVRTIWGKGDTVLFVFAGAAAEFALNKAVDWLYFTGTLPGDPLGRLFSTMNYARGLYSPKKRQPLKLSIRSVRYMPLLKTSVVTRSLTGLIVMYSLC